MKMRRKLIPLAIELFGITGIGAGIGIEMATGADIGWAVITAGSCLVAIGGVIWGKFMRGGKYE
jgi:hypothetical protein